MSCRTKSTSNLSDGWKVSLIYWCFPLCTSSRELSKKHPSKPIAGTTPSWNLVRLHTCKMIWWCSVMGTNPLGYGSGWRYPSSTFLFLEDGGITSLCNPPLVAKNGTLAGSLTMWQEYHESKFVDPCDFYWVQEMSHSSESIPKVTSSSLKKYHEDVSEMVVSIPKRHYSDPPTTRTVGGRFSFYILWFWTALFSSNPKTPLCSNSCCIRFQFWVLNASSWGSNFGPIRTTKNHPYFKGWFLVWKVISGFLEVV